MIETTPRPVSAHEAAVQADSMQAAYYKSLFAGERSELTMAVAKHVKLSTEAMAAGRMGQVSNLRRSIRDIEGEIRRIDRMVEALDRRFPQTGELRRRA